jgi:hypothetical protein
MKELVLLVDLENVQKVDQSQISPNSRIKVFVGAKQTKIPTSLIQLREAMGDRFEWVWIAGTGKNSLDFYIACYLGEALSRPVESKYVVLSGDTGFDPLLRHLKSRGLNCERKAPTSRVKPIVKHGLDVIAMQVVEFLGQTELTQRPSKRKTLTNHLVNHFQRKLSPPQITSAIEQLMKARLISGTDSALAYNF